MSLDLASNSYDDGLVDDVEEGAIQLNYTAEPTLARFHADDSMFRGIMGPIGSGKSVGCALEVFLRAAAQRKGKDGIRRSRWAIIRNTYPELKETTIKTFLDWFGEITEMKYDAPITGHIRVGDIDLELVFIAIDRPKDVKKLLSLELTGAWLNEARELRKTLVDAIIGRCGRYPSKRKGGSSWSGVIADTNPMDDTHWWYGWAEEEKPTGYKFFRQPAALLKVKQPKGSKKPPEYIPNPRAENVGNQDLGFEYWLRQIAGKTQEWIKVYILGQYGTVLDGQPVFSEYNDELHCAEDKLEALGGIALALGWDFGRTPAVIIGQLTTRGQLRIIDEVVVDAGGQGMGLRSFARNVVKPYLATHYPGIPISVSCGDPSGVAKDGSDNSCFDILADEGFPSIPSPTNDPTARQDAVIKFLTSTFDGEPGLLVSPTATYIRRGFLGGYRFAAVNISGDPSIKTAPEKNRFSHPHDGLQYLCQAVTTGANVVKATAKAYPTTQKSAAAWS
jgi:hypothetical protein